MRNKKFVIRIKPGGVLTVPPAVVKRLGVTVGGDVDFISSTGSGAISITKALSAQERRIARLRERLSTRCRRVNRKNRAC
jgi:bifunctional DNA-binding transcriptional regulator/antitoxin component of YhaV-PrlF toxin-antitoxin module